MTVQILPTRAAPDAATLAQPGNAKIWKTAQDFEAMAISQMLTPVMEGVDNSTGPFGGGSAEQMWKPMITENLGKKMAGSGGFGLALPVFHQMLRLQQQAQEARQGGPVEGGAKVETP